MNSKFETSSAHFIETCWAVKKKEEKTVNYEKHSKGDLLLFSINRKIELSNFSSLVLVVVVIPDMVRTMVRKLQEMAFILIAYSS